MKKLLSSIFGRPQKFQQLNLCPHHLKKDVAGQQMMNIKQPIPYSTDNCQTCNEHLCLVCSETHVTRHCLVKLNTMKQIGTGVLKNFNLGEVIKVDLRNLKCICGKTLNKGAAICAACGMASCSEQCHKQWEKLGNCKFADNFYNIPEGFNMRSILFDNIEKIQRSKAKQWIIANKSSTTMICCYATSIQPYVFLQRGYRNYGIPNPQLLSLMQTIPRALDYYIHFQRRCDCDCDHCQIHPGHSSTNCQSSCLNFDLQFMKYALMDPKNHKQCTCSCNFCQSGVIFNTHRFIDCMPFCKRSTYSKEQR